ncbi:hypothetical protein HPB52_024734 [Rhipicephalus sanguineus]|uniref:Uncharacterized protein n=1 Tax=Rhipicephalus sanguineus TaxID=34632 RepID=A0A9D4YRS0_RHISA|nr:hypothetical protein HPB52_024734 [Rhipicephalus sanguineus]
MPPRKNIARRGRKSATQGRLWESRLHAAWRRSSWNSKLTAAIVVVEKLSDSVVTQKPRKADAAIEPSAAKRKKLSDAPVAAEPEPTEVEDGASEEEEDGTCEALFLDVDDDEGGSPAPSDDQRADDEKHDSAVEEDSMPAETEKADENAEEVRRGGTGGRRRALTTTRRTSTARSTRRWTRRSSRKRPKTPRMAKERWTTLGIAKTVGEHDEEEAGESQDCEEAVESRDGEEDAGGEDGAEERPLKLEAAADGEVEYYEEGDGTPQDAEWDEEMEALTDDAEVVDDETMPKRGQTRKSVPMEGRITSWTTPQCMTRRRVIRTITAQKKTAPRPMALIMKPPWQTSRSLPMTGLPSRRRSQLWR